MDASIVKELAERAGEAWRAGSLPAGAAALSAAACEALPQNTRLQVFGAILLAGGVVVSGCRSVPAGLPRALLAAPVMVVNAALPLLFNTGDEIMVRVLSVLIMMCANLKTLALILDRGALVLEQWRLVQFAFIYAVPVYPRHNAAGKKGRLGDSAGGMWQMMLSFAAHMALFAGCIVLLARVQLPAVARYYAAAFCLYGLLAGSMMGPGALITGLLGLEVVPPFDKPWLSSSLADYWGRRWNNSINLMLRVLCFDPIVEGALVKAPGHHHAKRPSELVRNIGIATTFVVSGLAHEAMLAYIMPSYRFGWSYFFIVQTPLLLLERRFWRLVESLGIQPHWLMRCFVCQCLLTLTAHLFFFPPVEKWSNTLEILVQPTGAQIQDAVASAHRVVRDMLAAAN